MTGARCHLGALFSLVALSSPAATAEEAGLDGALYHSFAIGDDPVAASVSVELSPHAWRIGAIDGPPATETQLRAVLARLGAVEIGGRCAGWIDGSTAYPCGFTVEAIDLGGLAGPRHPLVGFDWDGPRERLADGSGDAGRDEPARGPFRFVALHAPRELLGDRGDAFGRRLTFKLRALSNALMPSQFDRAGGQVVLRRSRVVGPQA